MISWFTHTIVTYLEEAVVWVANLIISSIGELISFLVSNLPDMPAAVTLPSGGYLTWVSYGEYWFPITYMLTLGASLLVIWLAWLVIAIPFRWAKAAPGGD